MGRLLSVLGLLAGSSPAAMASPLNLLEGDAMATAFGADRVSERAWQLIRKSGSDRILYIDLPSTNTRLGYAYERVPGNARQAGQMQHRLWWMGPQGWVPDYPDLRGIDVQAPAGREWNDPATAKHLLASTKIEIWRAAAAGSKPILDLSQGVTLVDHCLRLTTGQILTDQRSHEGQISAAKTELASVLSHPVFRRVRRAIVRSNSVSPLIRASFLALGRPLWAPQHRNKPLATLRPGLDLARAGRRE